MVGRHRPTDDDRRTVIKIALSGLAHGDDLGDIAARLAPFHPRHDTFPAEVLLDLAADAIGPLRRDPAIAARVRAAGLGSAPAFYRVVRVRLMRRRRSTGRQARSLRC
jgi:hypothetical protein